MYKPGFASKEEENDFNKTRVDSLGLSIRTANALESANIRTVGGILRNNDASLLLIKGLGYKGIKEIEVALHLVSQNNERGIAKDLAQQGEITTDVSNDNYLPPIDDTSFLGDQDGFVSRFCNYFNIPIEDIKGSSRTKEIVYIRDLLIYFLRRYWQMSFPSIGQLLGKDHSTVMFAYRKVKDKISSDSEFELLFADFIKEISELKERKAKLTDKLLEYDIKKRKDFKLNELIKRTRSKREVPERNIKILEQYRAGATLQIIASSFGVTRERVRQVVKKTIKDIADNEALTTGVSVDFDELIKIEEEKRALIKRSGRKEKRKSEKRSSRKERPAKKFRYEWSRNYASCKTCNTTSIPHFINGLCESCGNKSISGEAREKMIIDHENECDLCGISRNESLVKYGRDFYLSRADKSVLCMKCHRIKTGKKLSEIKKNKWRMFYK